MGLLGHGSLSVLHSLFVGSRLQLAWPSLSSKRKIPKVTNQGRDRMQRQGRGSHKTVVKAWSRVMVLPQEIHRTISLSYLMLKLKLKLYYFGHLIQRANSLEKTVMLGKIESRKRRGPQRIGWLDGITDSVDTSLRMLQVMVRTGKPDML